VSQLDIPATVDPFEMARAREYSNAQRVLYAGLKPTTSTFLKETLRGASACHSPLTEVDAQLLIAAAARANRQEAMIGLRVRTAWVLGLGIFTPVKPGNLTNTT
jgi:hypothetical protein